MNNTLSLPLLTFCHSESSDQLTSFIDLFSHHEKSNTQRSLELLRAQLNDLPHLAGHIFVNFPVPATSECVTSVILYRGLIFVVSIDHHGLEHDPKSQSQVHHFARQFKEHHTASKDKFIIPVLLTPNAQPQGAAIHVSEDLVANTMCDSGENLAALIEHFSNQYKDDEIIAEQWKAGSEH
tara:strand:- start:4034 stop:4576 length:543 start_codon:yes stop_codon:yes gene_type:complete